MDLGEFGGSYRQLWSSCLNPCERMTTQPLVIIHDNLCHILFGKSTTINFTTWILGPLGGFSYTNPKKNWQSQNHLKHLFCKRLGVDQRNVFTRNPYMGDSENRDTPKWMVYNGKPYLLMDDLGVSPYFRKHPIHIYVYIYVYVQLLPKTSSRLLKTKTRIDQDPRDLATP